MKKIQLIIVMLLTGLFAYSQALNTWTQKTDFVGAGRNGAVGFSIGSKGYMGMGYNGYSHPNDLWEYDPIDNTWTQKADFGGDSRDGALAFSIGNKGYLGTGYDFTTFHDLNDFWEYDPVQNIWTRKADFGGAGRTAAVGFSIGDKGYLGTGDSSNRATYSDFWEYDPAVDTWTRKADFGGGARRSAVGFNIGGKGYIGTGYLPEYYTTTNDFWEYNPDANTWTKKAYFGGIGPEQAVGFSIGSKGYLGTGYVYETTYLKKDFWEYDPVENTWIRKADFGGGFRQSAVGFNIGGKGYIGTGGDGSSPYPVTKDFWEYTPDVICLVPSNLVIQKISDTCARLSWSVPDASVSHIKISYRALGSSSWIEDRKNPTEDSKVICGLTPNTTYEWKVRNICADDKTDWVHGPNFTTTSSAAFTSVAANISGNKIQGNVSVQIIPNPNKGNFTIQMQLPDKAASTTLVLYNSLGVKVWHQDARNLSGSVNKIINLESKLSTGVYVLIIQQNNIRLTQKVMVTK